ncbi:MAG TPA: hypothetical protein VI653_12875, partial [Steroidobacteraceae bacterium]
GSAASAEALAGWAVPAAEVPRAAALPPPRVVVGEAVPLPELCRLGRLRLEVLVGRVSAPVEALLERTLTVAARSCAEGSAASAEALLGWAVATTEVPWDEAPPTPKLRWEEAALPPGFCWVAHPCPSNFCSGG